MKLGATQMRLWSICSVVIVLALVNLAPSLAVAHHYDHRHHHHHFHHCWHHHYHEMSYSICNCRFGYGDVCGEAVSCSAEGGRCSGSCVHHPQLENSTPPAPENSTPQATSASTVTAETAKKCQALTAKAYPRLVTGNPAAGSANGMVETKEVYYGNCIAVYR
jgi:hypothetical protein